MQINLQKSKTAAQELAFRLAHFKKGQAFIVLMQEPYYYKHMLPYLGKLGTLHFNIGEQPRAAILVSRHLNSWMINHRTTRDLCACVITVGQLEVTVVAAYHDITMRAVPLQLENLLQTGRDKRIIIGSDTNAHSSLWGCEENNPRGDMLELFIAEHNLSIHNRGREPTFVTSRANSIIDVTLTNPRAEALISDWRVNTSTSCSDHLYLEYAISLSPHKELSSHMNLRKGLWADLHLWLPQEKDRPELPDSKDVIDAEAKAISDDIYKAIRKVCVVNRNFIGVPKLAPWWSTKLLTLRQKFRYADRRFKTFNTDTWAEKRNEAKRLYQKESRKAKRECWRTLVSELESQPAGNRVIKLLKRKFSPDIGFLKAPDGTQAESPQQTVELLMATHFPHSSQITSEAEWNHYTATSVQDTLSGEISTEKVCQAFKDFSPFKAAGEDGIPPVALQNLDAFTIARITRLYQKMIKYAYTPLTWRRMKVIFIPKPGKSDYGQAKAYRPITLSSFLLKGLEKILQWYLQEKVLKKPLPHQFAFTPGCSTEHALSQFVDGVEKQMLQGKFALSAALDIEGAFDNVTFESIRAAMTRLGVHPQIVAWYCQILNNRCCITTIKQVHSECRPARGTPQGGVLSALIWIMVMDGLQTRLKDHPVKNILFADDIILLATGPEPETLRSNLQDAVDIVTNWGSENGLRFNPGKTAVVLFTRRKQKPSAPIRVNNVIVEYTHSFRYLGVIIDDKLSWKEHINSRVAKCKAILMATQNMVGKTWGLTPIKVRWLYNTVICPVLTYGCLVWGHAANSFSGKLQQLQRMALVAMTGCIRTTPTKGLNVICDLIPLEFRIKRIAMNARLRTKPLCPTTWDGIGYRVTGRGHHRSIDQELLSVVPVSATNKLTPTRRWLKWPVPNELLACPKPPMACYTDGSREDDRTGAGWAICLGNTIIHEGCDYLGVTATVYQAEVYAILKVTEWLLQFRESLEGYDIWVYSDCKSAVAAIKSRVTNDTLVLQCIDNFALLLQVTACEVAWVKGHADCTGNELADALAKQGNRAAAHGTVVLATPISFTKRLIKEHSTALWQDAWDHEPTCRQTRRLVPIPWSNPVRHFLHKGKEFVRRLVEIFTGHGPFRYMSFKRGKPVDPKCRFCRLENETSGHILFDCPALMLQRAHLLSHVEERGGVPLSTLLRQVDRFFAEPPMVGLLLWTGVD